MSIVLSAPERAAVEHDRTAFHIAVWNKVVADPDLARLPYRIETDKHGQLIMSPPPAPEHGEHQVEIAVLLRQLIPGGKTMTECPISTQQGIKAADVAWASHEIRESGRGLACLPKCPEICVEILSPSNTKSEIDEKIAAYFDSGAKEVWICEEDGTMRFLEGFEKPINVSALCPKFPQAIEA